MWLTIAHVPKQLLVQLSAMRTQFNVRRSDPPLCCTCTHTYTRTLAARSQSEATSDSSARLQQLSSVLGRPIVVCRSFRRTIQMMSIMDFPIAFGTRL